jgi:serine protease Do
MYRSILRMLTVPLFVIWAYPVQLSIAEPFSQSFGYSSEDFGGGSSYLGVDTRDITPDRLGPLKLKEERGVEITMVDQDAPAGKAGLKEHDVILSLNGNQVESVEQLRRMIREVPPGRVISLSISRDGQPLTIKAQLADRKETFASAPHGKAFKFAMPAMPAMPVFPDLDMPVSVVVVHSPVRSGLMVENLTPQLADFFGAKNGQGVLVRSVDKGSRAEKAGFRAGDVIVRVNGDPINDTGDFTRSLHARKENTVTVNIIRDKKEQTLTLTLPEHRQSGFLDENFEIPELDADVRIDLSKMQSELACIKPKLEQAAEEIRRQAAEFERSTRPEMERNAREWRENQEHFRREMREMERELRDKGRQLEQELKREFHDSWTEI